ncbi:hypothetical protein SUGI_0131390 [Cryptomeria japonica]|nr:hypothetical protein SUGI_0131390 [Cryptomeria japonica]
MAEMQIGVWRNLPEEIALNVIARLLPKRSLVRLRTVWKAWNEMLSSYAAMRRIYPNIHLSYTSSFLFQFEIEEFGKVHSWVMEGTGDFYEVGEYSYFINLACNTMFCLSIDNLYSYYLCDEKRKSLKCIIRRSSYFFIGNAFDSSSNQFIMVAGQDASQRVDVYTSLSNSWNKVDLGSRYAGEFWVSGLGIYNRGRFYWMDNLSFNGGVVEFNLSDNSWTKIPPPHDAISRDSDDEYEYFLNGEADPYDSVASKYWFLAGSDTGPLVLVEREYGFMWELESGGGNINSERSWRRVDMRLPNEIKLVSVNNFGWTVVVAEGIDVYDGSRRLVRKFAIDDLDPDLGTSIECICAVSAHTLEPLLLPLECTYLWWPGHRNF